tara:strand:- start:751 stop:1206 length:456 start_codon:yes stop_codon:yes gene_type:complete
MKKLLLLSVSLLIAAVSFSQKIKVTVTEAQQFMKWGQHDYLDVLTNPESIEDNRKINCNYVFDLDNKTSTFSNKSSGTNVLPIVDFEEIELGYVISFTSYGDIDPSFTYPIKVYINLESETMYYTKYDPYMGRSFVTPCKSIITVDTTYNL